ncbi:MAG TPA: hypothetical protein VI935_09550 [Thermodesulfobacteriota bacterium]|nr:hypothetical protein [Thermodesulfobacteriota bacterium]
MIRPSHRLSILLFVTLLLSSTVTLTKEPENLHLAKQAAIFYHDSGEYDYDLGVVVQEAQTYLEERIPQKRS